MNHDPQLRIDCLVVGGGPAGLTATLYLRRFQRRVVLVDAGQSRALRIDRTHNLPGFPDGIAGEDLLSRLRTQVAEVRGTVTEAEVRSLVSDGEGGFIAEVGARRLAVRQVVLATGVIDREPPLPGLALLRERGLVRYCPICDGHEHRNERIVVIGDGTHAANEAEFLTLYSPHITRVGVDEPALAEGSSGNRSAGGPANLAAEPPPTSALPSTVQKVGPRRGGGLFVQLRDGSQHDFDVLYMAMGVAPRNQLAVALGARLDAGANVEVDSHCRTSVPKLYAVGDVVGGLDQLVTAAAQGAIAATAVHNSL